MRSYEYSELTLLCFLNLEPYNYITYSKINKKANYF